MRIRNNTEQNDWTFGHGKSDYITGHAGVALNIKTKINEWKRDCFFNLQAGIDWRTRLGSKNQRELLDTDVQNIIISIPEVLALTEYQSIINDRAYTADFTYYDIYSETPYTDTVSLEQ
jgi:hypothetical protein